MGASVLFHWERWETVAPMTPSPLTNSVMCQTQNSRGQIFCQMNPIKVSPRAPPGVPAGCVASDERVGVHGVLDLLRLQRRRQLQR